MFAEAQNQLEISNHSLDIVFVLPPDREDIYDKFIEQKIKFEPSLASRLRKSLKISLFLFFKSVLLNRNGLPSNWERPNSDQIRFTISTTSSEYNSIIEQFK